MTCKKVLSRLHAYLDGEMPTRLMREVEMHLGTCQSCRNQVERIHQVGDMLDSLNIPPLPPGFSARVMAKARNRGAFTKGKRSFFPLEWQPLRWFLDLSVSMRLAACAMALLACLLGMFMSRDLSRSATPRSSIAEAENLDGFEWFSPTPPTSLAEAYLALASTPMEDLSPR